MNVSTSPTKDRPVPAPAPAEAAPSAGPAPAARRGRALLLAPVAVLVLAALAALHVSQGTAALGPGTLWHALGSALTGGDAVDQADAVLLDRKSVV